MEVKNKINSYFRFLIRLVVVTTLLFSGYYVLYLKPKLALPNKLVNIERVLYIHQAGLVENRLNFVELTKFNPNSALASEQVTRIISKLLESNTKGIEELSNQDKLPETSTVNSKEISKLLEDSKKLYQDQKTILDKLNRANEELYDIFAFSPTQQFSEYNDSPDKERYLEEIEAATRGLEKIKAKSKDIQAQSEPLNIFASQVDNVVGDLNSLKESVSRSDKNEIDEKKQRLSGKYRNLRISAMNLLKSLVRDDLSVKLLKDQANLIYKYEHLQQQIDKEQKEFKL